MIVIENTESLEVVLESAVTTTELAWTTGLVQAAGATCEQASSETGATTGTTAVAMVSGASGKQKRVSKVTVFNRDTVSATVIIRRSSTLPIIRAVLLPNWSLHYGSEFGWTVKDDSGNTVPSGGFGSSSDVTLSNGTLSLTNANAGLEMQAISSEPSTPSSGKMHWYSKSIAGRIVPKVKGPSGLDYPIQSALWQNNNCLWTPSTVTAGLWIGTAGAGAGTYTTALPTTTNLYTAAKRGRWANVITTTNQVLGQRNSEAMFFRGNSTGQGGFFFFARCGFDVWTNGGRFFAGMHSATTVVSAEPSALANTVGFCVDAADNGAISFLTRDGSTSTKASTGLTIVTNKGYDVFMFCPPNGNYIGWRIIDFVAGTEASGTATLTLPVSTTLLTAGVLASNAALTPVTSIQLGINKIYVETDY